jgi:hypothetical protein
MVLKMVKTVIFLVLLNMYVKKLEENNIENIAFLFNV